MKRRLGDEVRITYDWNGPEGEPPETGDLLRSSRSCYLILDVARVNSTAHRHRLKVRAVTVSCDEIRPQDKVFELRWCSRGKRKG